MSGDITPYTSLVTSEHSDKPHFIAAISALVQPFADQAAVLQSMPGLYDIDVAAGTQLDAVGEWVGVSRNLQVPLTGVYFALDTSGVGLDQGIWQGPFDPSTELDVLPDSIYRQVLYARIANNQWDGTVPTAYKFMQPVFPAGSQFFIQDNGDMSMYVGVLGATPLPPIYQALLTGGDFNIKPAGVRINGYVTPSVPGDPVFGFDADGSVIGGLDHGCWPTITGGS
jgi:hypothetical protein